MPESGVTEMLRGCSLLRNHALAFKHGYKNKKKFGQSSEGFVIARIFYLPIMRRHVYIIANELKIFEGDSSSKND